VHAAKNDFGVHAVNDAGRPEPLQTEPPRHFLKQAEAGMPVALICRKGGFSDATFYKWRSKFGSMTVPRHQFISNGTSHRVMQTFLSRLDRARVAALASALVNPLAHAARVSPGL
jgi:hypothetical protein